MERQLRSNHISTVLQGWNIAVGIGDAHDFLRRRRGGQAGERSAFYVLTVAAGATAVAWPSLRPLLARRPPNPLGSPGCNGGPDLAASSTRSPSVDSHLPSVVGRPPPCVGWSGSGGGDAVGWGGGGCWGRRRRRWPMSGTTTATAWLSGRCCSMGGGGDSQGPAVASPMRPPEAEDREARFAAPYRL
uniref:Uncharacterized protein n=1 Tax=Leersia perrieri TaxID=77586 RepID=A0A0D9WUY2_9ORYZ